MAGGMHGRGHAWQGARMAGGMCGGHVWQGACMAGGMHATQSCCQFLPVCKKPYCSACRLTESPRNCRDLKTSKVLLFLYHLQRSWGKVIFSQASVILSTEWVVCSQWGCLAEGVCSWGVPGPGGVLGPRGVPGSRGMPGPGGAWFWGSLFQGVPGGGLWRPPSGYCCGWYAFYWNAFFFFNFWRT